MSACGVRMRLLASLPRWWVASLVGVVAWACGLSDVFKQPGLEQVTLTYPASDTLIYVGTTTAPAITVQAGGVTVPNPHFRFTSLYPTVVGVTVGGDSLIALAQGFDTVTAVLLDPIFTDTLPTITQGVRVHP